MNILEVDELKVKVANNIILDSISFYLKSNETYVLFGPNGSGKTTLINTIMGLPQYELVSGKIMFLGEEITNKDVYERSKLGISLGFQIPPEITGIKLSVLLKICLGKESKEDFSQEERKHIEAFKLSNFLNREINVGFSGGERKRAEVLQMIFLKPKLLLLDEPDSGVDIESLRIISSEIQKHIEENGCSALIITHKGDILEYIKSNYACVLLEGNTHCFENPREVFTSIKKWGYQKCLNCPKRTSEGWEIGKKE